MDEQNNPLSGFTDGSDHNSADNGVSGEVPAADEYSGGSPENTGTPADLTGEPYSQQSVMQNNEPAPQTAADPFSESDFGSIPAEPQKPYMPYGAVPPPPPPHYSQPQYGQPFPQQTQYGQYSQPYAGYNGNMYGNNNMYAGNGYPNRNPGGYPPPPPPPVYTDYGYSSSPAANSVDNGKKRFSTAAAVATAVVLSVLFMGLMILIGVTSSDGKSSSQSVNNENFSDAQNVFEQFSGDSESPDNSSGTKITLPVKSKPVQENKYYQDESTGLLTVAGVAKTLLPSVVEIEIFGDTKLYPISRASGVIISDDGYIVTNAHVVSDAVSGVKVTLNDGREFDAEIIGQDSRTDLAVISIDAEDLTPADIGDSSELELGEMVTAIGNCEGYERSVSVGYVSGLDREITISSSDGYKVSCIQTDAAMSPGISGGALVNMYGQVVGITTLKHKTSELDEGINFAISSNFAVPIIEDIISKGYIEGRIRIGIMYIALSSEEAEYYGVERGLYISSVASDCDISNTELASGDIIMSINGVEVYNENSINEAIKDLHPGDTIAAHVFRKGITEDQNEEFDIEFKVMQDKNLG